MYKVELRALEPEDLGLLYVWENDKGLWYASDTITPLSRYNLREFLLKSHLDIYAARQVKLLAEIDGSPVGFIDLFDFDPHNLRISIGILVFEKRGCGIGTAMLDATIEYAFKFLGVHQLNAIVGENNIPSIKLFRKKGFMECGLKKEWMKRGNNWENVIEFQLLNR